MNAQVFDVFTHEHNRREVAEQEYELAKLAYEEASQKFDARDVKTIEAFHNARERRSLAWDVWWNLHRSCR